MDAGTSMRDSGVPEMDAGTSMQDSGVPEIDAGTSMRDSSTREDGSPRINAREVPVGCGCTTPGTVRPHGAFAALTALGATLLRRRRR
jgi:MYXO-CTERM domain-containing protein